MVRSQVFVCRLLKRTVLSGTWKIWMGGGGGRVGKSLRFRVLESSVDVLSSIHDTFSSCHFGGQLQAAEE
jgi:hypothetical protein